MDRRRFLQQSTQATTVILLSYGVNNVFASGKKNLVILLVSGWQDVNIGDISHTPGLLHIFETFLPKAKVILWKRSNGAEEKKLLNKNFPKVKIIYGVNAEKNADNPEVMEAFKEADMMVHGSGPLLVGADNIACWLKHTSKPFGVFGVTLEKPNQYHQDILKKAAFIYTRETLSIRDLKKVGIEGPQFSCT